MDHSLVGVQVMSENMPFIGKARWAVPVGLLKNKKLKKELQELTQQLQSKVEQSTSESHAEHNPQMALKAFKTNAVGLYRDYQQTHQPKLENTIRSVRVTA